MIVKTFIIREVKEKTPEFMVGTAEDRYGNIREFKLDLQNEMPDKIFICDEWRKIHHFWEESKSICVCWS